MLHSTKINTAAEISMDYPLRVNLLTVLHILNISIPMLSSYSYAYDDNTSSFICIEPIELIVWDKKYGVCLIMGIKLMPTLF